MRYFLDTNILLDFVAKRQPFSSSALYIFNKALRGEWELWTSDNAVTTTYYVIEKKVGTKLAKKAISTLLKYLYIQPISKEILQTALISNFKDFEVGVQHFCALSNGHIDGIVTRNIKDFKVSQIPIFAPEDLLDI